MNSLPAALRAAAAAPLPEGAFLRRDRGDALFVTDAPRIRPGMDWSLPLSEAGFHCAGVGGLLRLWPMGIWLTRLEALFPEPPDDLCAGLLRFRGRSPDGESLRLFALGAKCLEGGEGAERFDRLLRQRAAVCLREERNAWMAVTGHAPAGAADGQADAAGPVAHRGGGLYACAIIDHGLRSPV